MSFECTKCGECCKRVGLFPFMRKYDRGDGACIHLTEDNLCDIYEERPDICNTDKLFQRIYSRTMSREEYDRMNMDACRAMMPKGDSFQL